MIFTPTAFAGLILVRATPAEDARGDFARLWCADEFLAAGLAFTPRQLSVSRNKVPHTLRGLHWQAPPYGEVKLVRAARGVVFDVAVDLRPDSATRHRWFGIELDASGLVALLIPTGFAHGFLTLTADAEISYLTDSPYTPDATRGCRYDDPALDIAWPAAPTMISERDLAWPAL